jgi:flagellin
MSLGVLNNINAIYATNNLNSTSNSLSTVLQQLSSGSKINSGADDAAGLSLVNGLAANSAALSQSKTNSQEGVGLLTVADGALSQVTTLLNRAVTLATEVSNGTLNTSQQTAANQEYASILSEIDNIGSTTTYNQQKVFGGSDVAVYTGDSSKQSASQDVLHFATVSSSSVGDSGTMNYSQGQGTFINMSNSATALAKGSDKLGVVGTLTFTKWDTTGSTGTTANVNIITSANETLSGLVDQINSSGLGVSASLQTVAQAESKSSAYSTAAQGLMVGIEITGNVSTTTPTASGMAMKVSQGTTGVYDKSGAGAQTVGTAATVSVTGSGTAMISYTSSGSGSSDLSTYDLSTQANAQSALTVLNSAIANVAAQDGYIGAQINTLNSVSSVLSTQSTNVISAQNAVQATDYASATSNMSKYEILSQTGISALAQANSMQKEVTKLLQ